MYNPLDDNELDRLSKEAAGRYEAPGNANWQAIQAELDKVWPEEKKKRRFFIFWWLLPAMLLGSTAWWWLQKENSGLVTEKNIPAINTIKTDNTSPVQKPLSKDNTTTVPQEKATEKTITAKIETKKQPSITNTDQSAKHLPLQKSGKDISAPGYKDFIKKAVGKNEPALSASFIHSTIISPETGKSIDQQVTDKQTLSNSKTNADQLKANSDKIETEKPLVSNISATRDNHPPAQEIVEKDAEPVNQLSDSKNKSKYLLPGKGWSFAILAGVDNSTVKFKYANDPGINIGLMAGYHFSNRWSVHTGAIYTQKNYKLAGEDFTAPKGSWISNYTLENVSGYCRMWEVPFLIRYSVSSTSKKSFFVSTGLSSYFMIKENYTYFYYYNGLPITRGASYQSTDTHILSIGHLSVGFENRISNKLSLQIEPYAKIPFVGVGLGNIKLSSFGVNFSLQLRQLSKKQ